MRLLIDTHTALWWFENSSRLSRPARDAIASDSNHVLLSAVCVWEAAIKQKLGKLTGPNLLHAADRAGIDILQITGEHAQAAGDLPYYHGDPFDRMIAAQSRIEGMPVVSVDSMLEKYGVTRIW